MSRKPTYEELEQRIELLEKEKQSWLLAEEALLQSEDRPIAQSVIPMAPMAQEALQRSEKRYHMIFNHSPLGIVHFDQEGVILDCNMHFLEIMGAPREKVLGFNMLTSSQNTEMRSAVQKPLRGEIGTYEGEYRSATGNKSVQLRAIYNCLTSEEGTFLGAVALFEDISETRQAEAALKESESTYKRSRVLYARQALSESQLEQIEATLAANQARVASARAGLRHGDPGALQRPGRTSAGQRRQFDQPGQDHHHARRYKRHEARFCGSGDLRRRPRVRATCFGDQYRLSGAQLRRAGRLGRFAR